MALRNHPGLAAVAVCAPVLAAAVVVFPHSGAGARTEPAAARTAECADPAYSRSELLNVVAAYRRSAEAGRITLHGIDTGHYWASYDRCEDERGER